MARSTYPTRNRLPRPSRPTASVCSPGIYTQANAFASPAPKKDPGNLPKCVNILPTPDFVDQKGFVLNDAVGAVDAVDTWLATGTAPQPDSSPGRANPWNPVQEASRQNVVQLAKNACPGRTLSSTHPSSNGPPLAATGVFSSAPFANLPFPESQTSHFLVLVVPLAPPNPHGFSLPKVRPLASRDNPDVVVIQRPPSPQPPTPDDLRESRDEQFCEGCPCPRETSRACQTKHAQISHMIAHLLRHHGFKRKYHNPEANEFRGKKKHKEPCYIYRKIPGFCAVCINCYESIPTKEALVKHVSHPPKCDNHQHFTKLRKHRIVSAAIAKSLADPILPNGETDSDEPQPASRRPRRTRRPPLVDVSRRDHGPERALRLDAPLGEAFTDPRDLAKRTRHLPSYNY